MRRQFITLFLCFSPAIFSLFSCVDNGYDLSKDISLDMNVGGDNLSIPVGNTDPIKLSDLIDESDMLVVDETGQYAILKSDIIDPVTVEIDPVTIEVNKVNFDPVVVDFDPETPQNFGLGTVSAFSAAGVSGIDPVNMGLSGVSIGSFVAEFEQTSTVDVDVEVPDELIVIRLAELKEGQPSKLRLNLNFEGMPSDVDKLILDDFDVILPSFLVFSEEDHVTEGVLSLDGKEFDPHTGFSQTLTVTGLDFTGMNDGAGLEMEQVEGKNKLIIDSENQVSMQGRIKTGEITINFEDLHDIVITPTLTIDQMYVAKVTGTINPEIDPLEESVALDLGDDVDFLKDDAILEIHNPQILLTIGNTIGIPVDLTVNMYAKDDQGQIIEGSQVQETMLKIKAAEVDGETTSTKFIISRKGTQMEGYETVEIEDLSDLLGVIPDSILFEMAAKADQDETHHVDLTRDLVITGEYQVFVPLQFDNININYKDTIDGLLDDLSDVADKVKEFGVKFIATVENSIPLGLTLDVIPLGADGNEISGITVTVSESIPAGTGTETSEKDITIDLTAEDDALLELDALELNIKAANVTETEGGVPLNANQFVRLTKISLEIEGGIDLDLND